MQCPKSGEVSFRSWQEAAGALEKRLNPRLISGAILLTMLVHAVEMSKFVGAWTAYKAARAHARNRPGL